MDQQQEQATAVPNPAEDGYDGYDYYDGYDDDDENFDGYAITTLDPGPWLFIATLLFCVAVYALLPCAVSLYRRLKRRRRERKQRRQRTTTGEQREGEGDVDAAAAAPDGGVPGEQEEDEDEGYVEDVIRHQIGGAAAPVFDNLQRAPAPKNRQGRRNRAAMGRWNAGLSLKAKSGNDDDDNTGQQRDDNEDDYDDDDEPEILFETTTPLAGTRAIGSTPTSTSTNGGNDGGGEKSSGSNRNGSRNRKQQRQQLFRDAWDGDSKYDNGSSSKNRSSKPPPSPAAAPPPATALTTTSSDSTRRRRIGCRKRARRSLRRCCNSLLSIAELDYETRRIYKLGFPFFLQALLEGAAEFGRLAVIGHLIGTKALAAYTIVDLLVSFTDDVLGGIHESLTMLLSHSIGSGNRKLTGQYVQLSICLYVLFDIPVIVFWSFVISDALRVLGFDDDVAEIGQSFAFPYLFSKMLGGVQDCIHGLLDTIDLEMVSTLLNTIGEVALTVSVFIAAWFWQPPLQTVGFLYLAIEGIWLVANVLIISWKGWFRRYYCGMIHSFALKVSPFCADFLEHHFPRSIDSLTL